MKTKVSQYYDSFHWSCECGANSGRSVGYADEDFARRAAQLHTEMMHPGLIIKQQDERIGDLEMLTLRLQEVLEAYVQAHDAAQIGLDECECELCRQARALLKVQA